MLLLKIIRSLESKLIAADKQIRDHRKAAQLEVVRLRAQLDKEVELRYPTLVDPS